METARAYTRLRADCPARKAMRYYFEERTNKKFVGRRRATIVTTINEGVRRTKEKQIDFPVTPLTSFLSLQNIHRNVKNRKLSQKVVSQVVDWAYSL